MSHPPPDYSNFSMLEIFRIEAENQATILNNGLLELERDPASAKTLEALMRASHSLKGAAQLVQLPVLSRLAHVLEDCFVAAQRGQFVLGRKETDVLLQGADFFARISKTPENTLSNWETDNAVEVQAYMTDFAAMMKAAKARGPTTEVEKVLSTATTEVNAVVAPRVEKPVAVANDMPGAAGILRVTTETVNRLLGLAGESLVESRRLQPFAVSMQRLKRLHAEMSATLDNLRETLTEQVLSERAAVQLDELSARVAVCREFLAGRIDELDTFDRRAARLSNRLYQETLQVRMRPFGDGVSRFPRMVRDLARAMDKNVRLEIQGEHTQVDRDILEKLDAPLTHLLRNALDHGCQTVEERVLANKPAEGVVKLEARHSAGMLLVDVVDDGRGVDVEKLREIVVQKKLVTAEVAERLTEPEVMEFLFLPGFSTRSDVTEISGRGVGLDVVREMVKSVRGKIRVSAQPGRGTTFQLQLPLSLAVLRGLLVEVAGEPYALPLAQVVQTVKLSSTVVQSSGGRGHFVYQGEHLGLVSAAEVLEQPEAISRAAEPLAVVLGERGRRFGLIVDKLLGEQELVVQPLDVRLGKVRDVSAAATMEDGAPVLILDVEDLVLSVEKFMTGNFSHLTKAKPARIGSRPAWRILVVDDSITVRELQRKLLTEKGYHVELAVDGMDGWNMVRAGDFDAVVTDVDMPRMDGLELVTRIKHDPRLRSLPVVMLSHKDREADRQRGLAAGADEYLAKSGYQEEKLLQILRKLMSDSEK